MNLSKEALMQYLKESAATYRSFEEREKRCENEEGRKFYEHQAGALDDIMSAIASGRFDSTFV